MKPANSTLERLFRAARRRGPEPAAPLPTRLASRILAGWRQESRSDPWPWLVLIVRRALYGAALVMVVCLVWSYADRSVPDPDVALANYEAQDEAELDSLL